MNKKNKGFTLIELLVVIAIVGLLSSVVLDGLKQAREVEEQDSSKIDTIRDTKTLNMTQNCLQGELYRNCIESCAKLKN